MEQAIYCYSICEVRTRLRRERMTDQTRLQDHGRGVELPVSVVSMNSS